MSGVKAYELPVTLDDQPAEDDLLDFARYSRPLTDRLVDPKTRTPFTLGILGRWGTGKSTLMSMIRKGLQERGLATVWFNAWRYNEEGALWAALLQSILNQVADDLALSARVWFYLKLFANRLDWPTAVRLSLQALARAALVIVPLLLAWPWLQQWGQGTSPKLARLAGASLAAVLSWWGLVQPIAKAVREQVPLDLGKFRKTYDYKEHISFLDKFREHFVDIVTSLPQKNEAHLVVFIDDLDRCQPDRVLQVLDTIMLFLDVRGCIFVLGVDDIVIQKAVELKYKDSREEQRQYIEKAIQLAFRMPTLSTKDMREFVGKLPVQFRDERCAEVFVKGLRPNPRQVKRALNLFLFADYMIGQNDLLRGPVNPVRLAKIIVMQHSWPKLYGLCAGETDLLRKLEEHACLKAESKLPDHLLILHEIFTDIDAADDRRAYWTWFRFQYERDGQDPDGSTVESAEATVAKLEPAPDKEAAAKTDGLIELIGLSKEHTKAISKERWDSAAADIRTAREQKVPTPLLPESLIEFRGEAPLLELMALYRDEPDACFSSLGDDEIKAYFTAKSPGARADGESSSTSAVLGG